MNDNDIDENQIIRLSESLSQIKPTPRLTRRLIQRIRRTLIDRGYTPEMRVPEPEITEAPIADHLEHLTEIKPAQQAAHRTIKRAKWTLAVEQYKSRLWNTGKLLARRGIAAAILVALVLLAVFVVESKADAAQRLREVIKMNGAYLGWFRISLEDIPKTVQPTSSARVISSDTYINWAEDLCIQADKFEQSQLILWFSGKQCIRYKYNNDINELYIDTAPKVTDELLLEPALPLRSDFDAILALLDQKVAKDTYQVTQTSQGDYDRFDLDLAQQPASSMRFEHLTVWVDPDSKLIHKWKGRHHTGVELAYTFTYNLPTIRTVYDLSVPTDAVVIDSRPTPQVTALLDRLDSRIGIEEDFGNYLAVMAYSIVKEDGSLHKEMIQIYARDTDKRLYADYFKEQIAALKGWPVPDVDDVLEFVRPLPPRTFLVSDGVHTWRGRYHKPSESYNTVHKITDRQQYRHMVSLFSISGRIWPGRFLTDDANLRRFSIRHKLLENDDRPDQIGLNIQKIPLPPKKTTRTEYIFWLDPSRDDMPVDRIKRVYDLNGALLRETHRHYISYAQLPNDSWYPTHWELTVSQYTNGRIKDTRNEVYHLQIFPDVELDPLWFANPADRFKAGK